jgi:hypothetical protein
VQANSHSAAAQLDDNFVLVAVVMASVLFFAGVGTKVKARGIRLFMLFAGFALFVAGSLEGRPPTIFPSLREHELDLQSHLIVRGAVRPLDVVVESGLQIHRLLA